MCIIFSGVYMYGIMTRVENISYGVVLRKDLYNMFGKGIVRSGVWGGEAASLKGTVPVPTRPSHPEGHLGHLDTRGGRWAAMGGRGSLDEVTGTLSG